MKNNRTKFRCAARGDFSAIYYKPSCGGGGGRISAPVSAPVNLRPAMTEGLMQSPYFFGDSKKIVERSVAKFDKVNEVLFIHIPLKLRICVI